MRRFFFIVDDLGPERVALALVLAQVLDVGVGELPHSAVLQAVGAGEHLQRMRRASCPSPP